MSETVPESIPPARRRKTQWFALGALGVAGLAFAVITAGGIGENLVYYWGPSDVHAAGPKAEGATIRLGGMVAKDSVVFADNASGVEFEVTDFKNTVHVKSTGVPPQMFREGIGVVVEGTMTRGGYFESHRLMVSHGNDYRAPGDPGHADVKRLMSTTDGLESEGTAKR
jgi:cytochrome c-type biogenesis protein CcmE